MISCMSHQCSSVNRCLSISCSVSGHRPGCWGCRGMFYSLCSHRFQVTTLTTRVFTGRSTFPPPLPSSFLPKAGFLCSCKHSNSSMLFKIVFFFFLTYCVLDPQAVNGVVWQGERVLGSPVGGVIRAHLEPPWSLWNRGSDDC